MTVEERYVTELRLQELLLKLEHRILFSGLAAAIILLCALFAGLLHGSLERREIVRDIRPQLDAIEGKLDSMIVREAPDTTGEKK